MPETRVVNIRWEDFDVYCGRGRCPKTGVVGKWGNPFEIGKDGSRNEVIRKYEEWIVQQPELMASLKELEGKRLGCWCVPRKCHCSVLVRLLKGSN